MKEKWHSARAETTSRLAHVLDAKSSIALCGGGPDCNMPDEMLPPSNGTVCISEKHDRIQLVETDAHLVFLTMVGMLMVQIGHIALTCCTLPAP